jgi:flagellar hook assembly protein FlgD
MWIPYELSRDSVVTLRIYDEAARLVRTLDVGYRAAGVYRSRSRAAYWDGRNDVGEPVASGAYITRIDADQFHATGRTLIVR